MSGETEEELDKTIPQDRMMVLPRRSGYRYLSLFNVGFVVFLVFVLGVVLGRYWQPAPSPDDLNQMPALEAKIKTLELKNRELEQDLIGVRLTSSIDKNATSMVQESLAELEQTIAEQRKAIRFYKGMMSPTELQKGVTVRSMGWQKSPVQRVYTFDLVVQQVARRHGLVKGKVLIELEGLSGDKTVRYPINDISSQFNKPDIALKFKYFQDIHGEVKLPKSFIAQRVLVKVQAKVAGHKKAVTIEQNLPWRPK